MFSFYFTIIRPFWKEYLLTGVIGSIVSGLVVFEQRGIVEIMKGVVSGSWILLFFTIPVLNGIRTGLFTYLRHRGYTQLYSYFFNHICLNKLEFWDLYYDKLELINCCTVDIANFIDTNITIYSIIIRNLVSTMMLIYFLSITNWQYLVFAIFICICRSVFLEFFVRIWEKQNDYLKLIGNDIQKTLTEYITNNASLQIYGLGNTYKKILTSHLVLYDSEQLKDSILYGTFMFLFLLIIRFIDIGIYLIHNTSVPEHNFFEIQIVTNYFRLLSETIQNLSDIQKELKRNKLSINRLLKFHGVTLGVGEGIDTDTVIDNYQIEIKNLSFKYASRNNFVYKNYTKIIKEGETFYLQGASGCGKTTLIKLLLGLYAPTNGEILIGNKSTYYMSNDNLRKLIAVIPQEPVIFENKTLRENLELFSIEKKLSKAAIKKILEKVQLENLIPFLDRQIIQLSGGQKQRLSIARVLVNKHVPIIILDEAFSAMDQSLKKSMQKLVYNHTKKYNKTTIIIQH